MYRVKVQQKFSAAHHLRDYYGDCENVHGHNWVVSAIVAYEKLEQNGIALDFRELKLILSEVLDVLDHKDLNNIDYFKDVNPTSENIAFFIFTLLKEKDIPIETVEVAETDNCIASYSEK